MWQTTVRQYVLEPCLPPPVVRLIRETWDPYLSSLVGHDEGTVTLLVQALALLLVTRLLLLGLRNWQRRATGPSSSSSATTAIREPQDDDDEDDGIVAVDSATRYFSTTAIRLLLLTNKKTSTTTTSTGVVLLCGPPNAGKTTLFTQLLLSSSSTTTTSSSSSSSSPNKKPLLSTVTSLKANVALFGSNKNVCLIDWPGHAAAMAATNGGSFVLTDPTLSQIWSSSSSTTRSSRPLRLVLVLDATQPVQPAAAILYQLWHAAASTSSSSSSSTTRRSNPILRIFVACHKSDLPKAKNVKRLQLQLRTELEKLLAVQQPDWWPGKATATYEVTVNDQGCLLPGQVLQWYFGATSSTSLLLLPDDELLQFCQTGQWPVV